MWGGPAAPLTGLPKMRWFDRFCAAKQKKAQTTSGNNQHTADQNQFCRHEVLLSQNLCSSHRLYLLEFANGLAGYQPLYT